MKIGVPKEIVQNERRVALTPDAVGKLVRDGIDVIIESQAGFGSFFRDQAYTESGAKIVSQAADIYREASVVLKVHPPTTDEVELMSSGTTLLSLLQPSNNLEIVSKLVEKSITKHGGKILKKTKAAGVEKNADGTVSLNVEGPKGSEKLVCDKVLVAVGMKPRSRGIGLEELGVQIDPRGFVPTDEFCRTNIDGIYAIGDVSGAPMLAHPSAHDTIPIWMGRRS